MSSQWNDVPPPQPRRCPRCKRSFAVGPIGERCPDDGWALVAEDTYARLGDDRLLGRVLGSKYPLIDLLGRGGMGAVYLAIQEPVGREVAVKVIGRTDVGDAERRTRFMREARIIARLSHDAVVTLHDYGAEADDILYLVMERLRGRSLAESLATSGAMPAPRAAEIALQVLGALAEAHAQGLVHRDLKPDNIMLVEGRFGGDRVKVLDFGIAKATRSPEDSMETRQGLVLGTPMYMAPEQAIGGLVGPATDLYALGVVIYEMLAGVPPFRGTTPFAILTAHTQAAVPPLPEHVDASPALRAVVRRALAKEPAGRYQSAAEMAGALQAAVPGVRDRMSMSAGPPLSQTGTMDATVPLSLPVPVAVRVSAPLATVAPAKETRSDELQGESLPSSSLAGPRRRYVLAAGVVVVAGGVWAAVVARDAPDPNAPVVVRVANEAPGSEGQTPSAAPATAPSTEAAPATQAAPATEAAPASQAVPDTPPQIPSGDPFEQARVLSQAGRHDEAVEVLRRAFSIADDTTALRRRVLASRDLDGVSSDPKLAVFLDSLRVKPGRSHPPGGGKRPPPGGGKPHPPPGGGKPKPPPAGGKPKPPSGGVRVPEL